MATIYALIETHDDAPLDIDWYATPYGRFERVKMLGLIGLSFETFEIEYNGLLSELPRELDLHWERIKPTTKRAAG